MYLQNNDLHEAWHSKQHVDIGLLSRTLFPYHFLKEKHVSDSFQLIFSNKPLVHLHFFRHISPVNHKSVFWPLLLVFAV